MGKARREKKAAQRKKTKQKNFIFISFGVFAVVVISILFIFLPSADNENPQSQRDNSVIDLTVFNATMAHAEAEKILVHFPQNYIGKTIKMQGEYTFWNENGRHYAVVGGTGTCPKWFELKWDGGYPEEGTTITVTGVFDSYEEVGRDWYYLAVGEMLIR